MSLAYRLRQHSDFSCHTEHAGTAVPPNSPAWTKTSGHQSLPESLYPKFKVLERASAARTVPPRPQRVQVIPHRLHCCSCQLVARCTSSRPPAAFQIFRLPGFATPAADVEPIYRRRTAGWLFLRHYLAQGATFGTG